MMIKRTITFIIFILLLFSMPVFGANYTILTSTTTFDGDTDCGGACTSADTIIIEGGARGDLIIRDLDGSGSYIDIVNEDVNPDAKVIITNDGTGGIGILTFYNCKYIDIKGDNDGDLTYGIKVVNDNVPAHTGACIQFWGDCDNVKLSYVEIAFDGHTGDNGGGIGVGVGAESSSMIYDTFEIFNNYIHGSRYSDMYLGRNDPGGNDDPYIKDFSIHDNLMEGSGGYGITLKGVHTSSSPITIYNNTIKITGVVHQTGDCTNPSVDDCMFGIGVQYFEGSTYANIYNNWIEKTYGEGFKLGEGDHNLYDNIIVGCGTGDLGSYGHGVTTFQTTTSNIYDNIIIQPTRYGVYGRSGSGTVQIDRNLIGNPGVGYIENDAHLVEGTGANANIKEADVVDFNFNTWSDDSDYSNDRFRTRDLNPPNNGTDFAVNGALTWKNFGDLTGLDGYFEKDTNPPTVKVVDNSLIETYDPPGDLDTGSIYYWKLIGYGGAGNDTGAVYKLTTAGGPPVDPSNKADVLWSIKGGDVLYSDKAGDW